MGDPWAIVFFEGGGGRSPILRGPTHQKWSNFAIFGFIVQFDPWVGAHLWKKIRVLGALETPQMGGWKVPPSLSKIWKSTNFAENWLLYVKYKNKTIFFYEVFPFSS